MKKDIDLGILVNAEMYYDYDLLRGGELNSKTLQQQTADNVLAAPPQASLSQEPSEEEEKRENVCGLLVGNGSANTPISTEPGYVRLDPNAKYDRISIQLANLRDKGRHNRANVYVSLKDEKEQLFNVFLTGTVTSAKYEVRRGARNSQSVTDIVDALFDKYPGIMVGRLRYKPVDGYISDFHKKLTKSAIIGIYKNTDDDYVAVLVLYYEWIEIPLTTPMSEKQGDFYVAHGVHNEYGEFDDEEEL